MRSYLVLLFIVVPTMAWTQPKETKEVFQPQLVAMWVQNLERSVQWYTDHLGFRSEREITDYPDYHLRAAFLEKEGFHLELLEKQPSYSQEVVLSQGQELGGIMKLGFLVQELDALYRQLKVGGVDLVTDIGQLAGPELGLLWPKRYFLIQDPDGNYIQFFSHDDGAQVPAHPWLIMIATPSLELTGNWYQRHLEFTHLGTVGAAGNKRAILSRNDLILELFEPSQLRHRETLPTDSVVLGFNKLAFGVDHLDQYHSQFSQEDIQFRIQPATSDFPWATRHMTIGDQDANWVQFFELRGTK